jgi:hypothetical protein
MSKNTKIVLGIVVAVVILCFCVCVSGYIFLRTTGKVLEESFVMDDPQEAQDLAQSIVDYDLPPGYQEEGAFNMGIMKVVMIGDSSASDSPFIMIAEMPSGGGFDEEEMQRQLEQTMQQSMGNRNFNVQLVDEQTRTIRGDEVSLLFFEGTDNSGIQVKQIISELFQGKNGSVMFMIIGSESGWDQSEIDAFIDSIR